MEIGTTEKGKLGELYVFSKLIEKGAMPFLPIADIGGVDAVVRKIDGTYVEIQVKSTWVKDMAGYFNAPGLVARENLFIVGVNMYGRETPEIWILPSDVFVEHMTKKYLGIGTGYSDMERELRETLAEYLEAWHLLTGLT